MNIRPLVVRLVPARPLGGAARFVGALAVAWAAAFAAQPAHAQVQMNCVPVPLPSAYPADWRSTHSLCLLTMTNNLNEPVRCDLRVQLDQGGGTGTASEPRIFAPGQTVLVTQNIMNWSRLRFAGSIDDAINRTGHLPARPVQVTLACENMVGTVTNNAIPDVQIQISILPSIPPPPTLLTPSDASQVHAVNPVFTWTPTRLTTGQEVWYQFRLVKVLAGQLPARALEANYAVLETFVHQSNLTYPSAAPRLEDGALYAWRVQALVNAASDVNNAPAPGNYAHLGLNEGRSQVYAFVWRQPSAVTGAGPLARGAARAVDVADRVGGLIDVASDDHAAPAPATASAPTSVRIDRHRPTPADSLALALFKPRRNWWGPTSGDRGSRLNPTLRAGGDESGLTEGDQDATGTSMPVAESGAGPVPRPPIEIDSQTPTGEGLATRWFRIAGTSVAAGEVYTHSGAGLPSRPDNNGQLMAGMTLSLLNNKVNVPLQALVSGDQVSFRQSVNQLALHPNFRWGGLHAGNINPGYSAFSLADATVLGGGADIVRGGWYAGVVNGRMRRAIQPDTVNAVEAQFARNVLAARVGLGEPLGNAIEFEVMRARDDEGSLSDRDTLIRTAPAGNTVFGARARHTVFDTLTTVQVSGAWSRYDRNVRADVKVVNGGAMSAKISRRSALGEIGAALDYIGGGFISLGNSELAPDRFEGRLNGRRELFAGKLRVGGSVGLRRDDISQTLGGETNRRSLGLQAGWQPLPAFGTDFDFGVLSSTSPGTDQRAALEDMTNTFTMSPHLNWTWHGASQTLTSSLALQNTEFSDADAAGFANTRSTTVVAGWQSTLTRNLFVSLSGNYVRSEVAGFVTEIGSGGPGLSMTMLGGRAQANLQLAVTETHVSGAGIDRDLTPNIDARYLVSGRQMLVFRAGWRKYRTGIPAAGDFDERLASLQYSAAL